MGVGVDVKIIQLCMFDKRRVSFAKMILDDIEVRHSSLAVYTV